MVSNSQNPLRVYISCDVMFVETPQISKHVLIQIDEEVPKSNEVPIDVKGSNSKVENLVANDNTGNGSIIKTTIEDILIQLCQSTRVKYAPTQVNNLQYSMMFYLRQKVPGEFKEPQNMVLIIKYLVIYKKAMSRSDAIYWKKACTEKLEEFIRQNLFSTVPRLAGCKVVL